MNAIQLRQDRNTLYQNMVKFHSERDGKEWSEEDNAQWQRDKDTIGVLDNAILKAEEVPSEAPAQRQYVPKTGVQQVDEENTKANANKDERFFQNQAPASQEEQPQNPADNQWDDELRSAQARLEFREWMSGGTVRGRYRERYYLNNALESLRSNTDFDLRTQVRKLADKGDDLAKQFLRSETRAAGDLLIGTDTSGGYSVPDAAMAEVVFAMKRFNGVMEANPTVIVTDTGAPLPIPTINDVNNKAVIVGEGAAATRANVPFGQVTLGAYRYSTRGIFLSLEFLQDTSIDVESVLARVIGERLGRAWAEHYTSGTGVNEPQGLITGSTKFGATLPNTALNPTFANIVGLMTSIDGAYQAGSGYMFNQVTLGQTMQITGINSQPIWFPSSAPGIPANLLGRPYWINDEMETWAAGSKPMLYGDVSTLWVRNVAGLEIHRLNEVEIEEGMVGIVGFARSDSKMVNAGTNPVKYIEVAS